MGGPTSSIRYRQHSSLDHVTTQAPPLHQSRDTFGGILIYWLTYVCDDYVRISGAFVEHGQEYFRQPT
jgi:hypothetical protein